MANLASNLVTRATRSPDRTAIKLDATRWSYGALDALSALVAGLLRARGVRPGDRVALMLPNIPEFAAIYYGILRVGAVVVPQNVLFKRREIAYHLSDSGAALLFAWRDFADAAEPGAADAGTPCICLGPGELEDILTEVPALAEVCPREASETAVILYTSGTTGKPKGAQLSHGNLVRNIQIACELLGLDERSVVFGALPLFHSFGQTCVMNATVLAGGMLTLLPRFEAGKALAMIATDQITVLPGVPTMLGALLNHPDRAHTDVSSLRTCVSGGASLPLEVLRGFEAAFGCAVLEGYGLSETSPIASFNRRDRERKPGSIGVPIDGVEMRILDDAGREVEPGAIGEIAIRGHNVMKGYWQKPEATAEAITPDGWFKSGDLGRVDADGYFYIVDRKKDMIIRGGFNVYPRELEEVLYQHPAVRDAAVIGIAHDDLGEEVAAAVIVRPEVPTSPDELREFVKAQVAAYKYPRHIWFVDDLPRTATGKILKRSIVVPPGVGDQRASGASRR
jgi:long-chain acyl-CoA synthetase